MTQPPPYFVRRLSDEEARPGARFEVQALDEDGRAESWIRFDEESIVEISGTAIPAAVVAAARRQPAGLGDYVDRDGKSQPPF